MGRQSAFVREDTVRSARDVFWSEGYEGASMASLQRATGLNASSIYHAFGSKRGLFDAAIEDYLERVVRPGLAPLCAPQMLSSATSSRPARCSRTRPAAPSPTDACW